nr:m7gpppx diphosphatase [Quercus suber]
MYSVKVKVRHPSRKLSITLPQLLECCYIRYLYIVLCSAAEFITRATKGRPRKMSTIALLTDFKFTSILRSDSGGKRMILRGTISNEPALLLAERGAFTQDSQYWAEFPQLLSHIQNLGDNDVYKWFLANSLPENADALPCPPDLKINLIYPCTDKHIRKYSFQQSRVVLETPEIYTRFVRPYMARCREQGRLNWVFNILTGAAEQESVLFRSSEKDPRDDFLLLPDLNWDRKTLSSMHLLALVQRRDIWSVRDLRRRDVSWLRHFRDTLAQTVVGQLYPGELDPDLLKFYIHYQPTYYHFHVHIVHVDCEPTATQSVGKALGLDHVVSQLEMMSGGEDAGMADVQLSYTIGEARHLVVGKSLCFLEQPYAAVASSMTILEWSVPACISMQVMSEYSSPLMAVAATTGSIKNCMAAEKAVRKGYDDGQVKLIRSFVEEIGERRSV